VAQFPYNPRRVTGSFSGTVKGRPFAVQLDGVMDGEFYVAEYDEDRVTKHKGGQGDHAFVMNASTGTKFKAVFLQGAPVNEELSVLVPDAKRNYMPVGVLHLEDLNGTTVYHSAEAVIAKVPNAAFGHDLAGREWSWECGETEMFIGGSEEF
jgi:hypothetical protein